MTQKYTWRTFRITCSDGNKEIYNEGGDNGAKEKREWRKNW
jgi:hypothetical protein